ncbi:MAG: DUF4249 domain-containing protein [Flavobacteriales bacterium]|nr:DUF4249 domain-containing protein [Flavobacteriales bacterium]MBK7296835.1 DUF4249 domain-containing protein [Flavobacteriales bacterium]MBK9536904.1 DUF4249 domain-containing protein [Flavobacteriales bacterium]MBP9138985.1 DUF4249 domain-containing protein [Flavobacteriales bacterium]HQV52891.1 DUF4249 family protein [Flavobacteriales bacterium]
MKYILPLCLTTLLLASCTKDITVKLPETEAKVVVEGIIETDGPPLILLTRTQGFFDPTSIASIAAAYISEAEVTVNDGFNTYTLNKICSDDLINDSLLQIAAELTGIDAGLLAQANICAWTNLDGTLLGVEGRTYSLNVVTDGKTLTSKSTIPNGIALDSLWFKLAEQNPNDDSLGYIWNRLQDPDTLGNAYRWFYKRLNNGPDGRPKDSRFIAPFFSAFEDKYINGLEFDFAAQRGTAPFSDAVDDDNEERGYFKRNDTVAVKFASMGIAEYRFYNTFYTNASSQGDIFSNPANIVSNINGGLGIWAGLATRYDTVICVP